MQTSFAIALLAITAQAIQIAQPQKPDSLPADHPAVPADHPAVPADLAQQSTTGACAGYVYPTMDTPVDWGQTFHGPSEWFNMAEGFWQWFTTAAAFTYFDCARGNGDGLVTFNELNDGLFYGGFTPTYNCSETLFASFQANYDTTEVSVDEHGFVASFGTGNAESQAAIFNGNMTTVSHNDFMRGAVGNMGMDSMESQVWWQACAAPYTDTLQLTDFQAAQQTAAWGLWDFSNNQTIALGDYMPSDLWYVMKDCGSGEQWWAALTKTKQWTSWQSEISYDLAAWQADHCTNMGMCGQ